MTATTDTGAVPTLEPARPSVAGRAPAAGPVIPAQTARTPERAAGRFGRSWHPGAVVSRLRAHRGLTGPGATALAAVVLAPGVGFDLAFDGSVGLASAVFFVLASLAAASTARPSALVTAAVLPPLLLAAAVTTLAWLSGRNEGTRQLALDVGTSLALSAPLLFATTAATVTLVLTRATLHLLRR